MVLVFYGINSKYVLHGSLDAHIISARTGRTTTLYLFYTLELK